MTNEKKYQITEEVLESWPGPRILQDETFSHEFIREHPLAACKVSEVYLITEGERKLAGATYLAATKEGFELFMTANNGALVSRARPSFTKKPLILVENLETVHAKYLTESDVRPPIVTSNLLAAYTLHPFEGLPNSVNGRYESVRLVDYFSYVLASETIEEHSNIEYITPNDMWFRSTLGRVFALFDDFVEGRRVFLGALDWGSYFRTVWTPGFRYWGRNVNVVALMTYLTQLFFDRDFTEGLYKFADGRAREILERFMDPEYQAKVNAMMAIEAALQTGVSI